MDLSFGYTWNPLMTLVLIGNSALFFFGGGWVPSIIEVIWVPGIYIYIYLPYIYSGRIYGVPGSGGSRPGTCNHASP